MKDDIKSYEYLKGTFVCLSKPLLKWGLSIHTARAGWLVETVEDWEQGQRRREM